MEAHGIPPHVAMCTTQIFKDTFTDSKIAQKFSFSHSKQGYGITYGLEPHYNDELTSRLKVEHFSINIDESTETTLARETEVIAFNRRRKIKETASLHRYKLSELAKQLVAAERATDLKQSNAANAKQQGKMGGKRSLSDGKDQHVAKTLKK